MFAFFIISFFIRSKSKSVLRGEQLQFLPLMPRGSSPWGGCYWVCSNKHILGMKRNGEQSLSCLSTTMGAVAGCWWLLWVQEQWVGSTCSVQAQLRCWPCCRAALAGQSPHASSPSILTRPLYPTRAVSGCVLWGCVTFPIICRHLG